MCQCPVTSQHGPGFPRENPTLEVLEVHNYCGYLPSGRRQWVEVEQPIGSRVSGLVDPESTRLAEDELDQVTPPAPPECGPRVGVGRGRNKAGHIFPTSIPAPLPPPPGGKFDT